MSSDGADTLVQGACEILAGDGICALTGMCLECLESCHADLEFLMKQEFVQLKCEQGVYICVLI